MQKNAAGQGALGAAASNVTLAYAKLLAAGTAGNDNAALLTALSAVSNGYTTVGDYMVTYEDGTIASKDVKITLSLLSVGKFGTPSSKNVVVIQ